MVFSDAPPTERWVMGCRTLSRDMGPLQPCSRSSAVGSRQFLGPQIGRNSPFDVLRQSSLQGRSGGVVEQTARLLDVGVGNLDVSELLRAVACQRLNAKRIADGVHEPAECDSLRIPQ